MIRIFIGYDPREKVAYHTLVQSIIENASEPVSITPIAKKHLGNIYQRTRTVKESTEFSLTRFLTPYLSGFNGWSIFMDCDMIVTSDIKALWELRDNQFAVMCVKHDYTPSSERKFLDQIQTVYPKKNWSSVMLFNNAKCTSLTPEMVQHEDGLFLHQFKWLESEELIGEIPHTWNFLVGEEEKLADGKLPNLIHYTLGGPYFDDYKGCDYEEVWEQYKTEVTSAG
jgi:lipopolysaccharide biosynthesis glycosyltransferase